MSENLAPGVAAPQGSLCTFETMIHLLVFLREPMHLSPQPALNKENMHSIAHTGTAKELENLRSWICKLSCVFTDASTSQIDLGKIQTGGLSPKFSKKNRGEILLGKSGLFGANWVLFRADRDQFLCTP